MFECSLESFQALQLVTQVQLILNLGAMEVQAILLIDQDGGAHLGVVDIGQGFVQRACRAGGDAGDVFAHLASDFAGREEGRAGGGPVEPEFR